MVVITINVYLMHDWGREDSPVNQPLFAKEGETKDSSGPRVHIPKRCREG